tara:strand:- start:5731 stop:6210 length:480 start_codon:yes stop_codon:yes gene_type:complete
MTDQTFNYTPDDICEKIINYLELDETKSYCEPFSGNHNIFKLLPENKEYYEIQEDKNFFECSKQYDVIITNPPYRDYETDKQNILIKCLDKCFEIATEKCVFLLSIKLLNSITPVRLHKFKEKGWVITDVCVINIPKWYGRYYLLTFEKDAVSVVNYIK